MRDGILLSPLDRRISEHTDRDQLQSILVHSLLFEREVIIPDVYFFNSEFLLHYLRSSTNKLSLIEAGIRGGAIRPALRESAKSFDGILQYLRREAIYGLLPTNDVEYIAGRMVSSLGEAPLSLLWPERLAETYEQLLATVFGQQHPPGPAHARVDEDIWAATAKFRTEGLEMAREVAGARPENYGLRRADVLRAISIMLGIAGETDPTPSEEHIIASTPAASRVFVERFIIWLDELYFANQSMRFDCPPTSTSPQLGDLALIEWASSGGRERAGSPRQPVDDLEVIIDVPRMSSLLQLDASRFMELRNYGLDWYANARRFMSSPGLDTRRAAEASLAEFAKNMRQRVRHERPQPNPVKVAAYGTAGAVALAAAELTQYAMQWPPITSLGSVALAGYVLHGWVRQPRTDRIRVQRGEEGLGHFVSVRGV